jgi:hypothetical protein
MRSGDEAVIYALAHNRAHTNVASMFREDERLVPEKDTVTIVPGTLGSYPNFLFDVDVSEIDAFVGTLTAVTGPEDLDALAARWGVCRSEPAFWNAFDWIHEDFRRREPTRSGLLDLNRYENL